MCLKAGNVKRMLRYLILLTAGSGSYSCGWKNEGEKIELPDCWSLKEGPPQSRGVSL